ncbi:MAG: hypothetical protein AB7L09_06965 [Nitrospira sp.]
MVGLSHSRWRLLLGGLSLAWLFILALVHLTAGRHISLLQNSGIKHDTGCAYISPLRERPLAWPIATFIGDSTSDTKASTLILHENGKAIGRAHALHDTIRVNGLGDYSHWGKLILFSASDCSDPRTNGRSYEVVMQSSLSQWAHVTWFIATIVVGLVGKYYVSKVRRFRRLISYVNKSAQALLLPTDSVLQRPVFGWMVLFILMICAGSGLVWIWSGEESIGLAVAGSYQISDSMMYWLCANSLLDTGNFGHPLTTGEWCQRRAIYPTFLSGIALVAQRNIFATLLVQAFITATAIYLVVRRGINFVGAIGALLCGVLLFIYATVDLFPMTMTENAGLVFGCVGVTLLLQASEHRAVSWMAAGIAMISIALNARAGAFFILPFLVLWAGITAWLSGENVWKWVGVASIATITGFMLQAILVFTVGGSPGSAHGNFSYVLYGLSVGGKGWQQVLIDHPELSGSDALMSETIYGFAWQNLTKQPELFLHGLQKNISYFMSAGTYGFERLGAWSIFCKACWWLAWVPMVINRRNPSYLLVALCSLGAVLSAPILLGDGGPRIFAASVAIDGLQVAIGLSWAGTILTQGIKEGLLPAPPLGVDKSALLSSNGVSLERGFVVVLLLLLLIPHTPLKFVQAPDSLNATRCINDEYAAVTHIGSGGALLLDFEADNQKTDFLKGQIRYADFIKGISLSAWWRDEALSFRGKSLLVAYQQDRSDPYAPGPYLVFSDQHLAEFDGRTVRLCIDKREKQMVFGMPYRKLNSITVLD